MEPPPRNIITSPALQVYIEHFGELKDDMGLVAESDGQIIGAALMKEILTLLKSHGYKRVSLSVQKANYTVKLYLKVGFEVATENEDEYIMVNCL